MTLSRHRFRTSPTKRLAELRVVDEDEAPDDIDVADIESGPVVKLANMILNDAVAQKATDVHIQPHGNKGLVRFRVDGVLRDYMELPHAVLIRVISRVQDSRPDGHLRSDPPPGRARTYPDEPTHLRSADVHGTPRVRRRRR